jgi:hypothetical protein
VEIARHVHEEHGVPGWWTQSVAVGYERARGMRAAHQRPDGYQVSVSKTFPVELDVLFRAFTEAGQRARWLDPGTLEVRTTQPGRSARFDLPRRDHARAGVLHRQGPSEGRRAGPARAARRRRRGRGDPAPSGRNACGASPTSSRARPGDAQIRALT